MTESDVTGHEPEALDRRRALERLGLTAGAGLAAPAVVDSYTNLAGPRRRGRRSPAAW